MIALDAINNKKNNQDPIDPWINSFEQNNKELKSKKTKNKEEPGVTNDFIKYEKIIIDQIKKQDGSKTSTLSWLLAEFLNLIKQLFL